MTDATPAPTPVDALGRAMRHDGWTPERQARFLRAIAEGHTVTDACRAVGLSTAGAYALRDRAAPFALAWDAANLRARTAVADALLARAIHGQVEWRTGRDGARVERFRYDNALATRMLARLDQQAGPAGLRAARAAAGAFEDQCDAIERGDGAASGDLDPDARATWTGEQWRRAEAAGLVSVAPASECQDRQLVIDDPDPDLAADGRIWREEGDDWRTDFPPPPGFDGWERGEWGDEEYERELTDAEYRLVALPWHHRHRLEREEDGAERDRWFAAATADQAATGADQASVVTHDASPDEDGDDGSARWSATPDRLPPADAAAVAMQAKAMGSGGPSIRAMPGAPFRPLW